MTLAAWQQVFANATSLNHKLDVHLQAVVFDADVHLDNVISGGIGAGPDFVVQSRKMLGYVQLKPSSILIPDRMFADLLKFQNGSLGGPGRLHGRHREVEAADAPVAGRRQPGHERSREERIRERSARLTDSAAGRLVVGRAAAHRYRRRQASTAARRRCR